MRHQFVVRCFAAMSLVAAFMFVGCSDDSSSVESDGMSELLSSSDADEVESSSSAKLDEKPASSSSKVLLSSSAEEVSFSSFIENSSNSEIVAPNQSDFVIEATEFESRVFGDEVRFMGKFMLDLAGGTTVMDSSFYKAFIGIEFKVAKGNDVNNMTIAPVMVNSNPILTPTLDAIDLNSMNSVYVSINLLDPGFTECGVYSLIVSVTASNGKMEVMRTEIIPFERDSTEYCRTENTTLQ